MVTPYEAKRGSDPRQQLSALKSEMNSKTTVGIGACLLVRGVTIYIGVFSLLLLTEWVGYCVNAYSRERHTRWPAPVIIKNNNM